jgi:hypothetical protein
MCVVDDYCLLFHVSKEIRHASMISTISSSCGKHIFTRQSLYTCRLAEHACFEVTRFHRDAESGESCRSRAIAHG